MQTWAEVLAPLRDLPIANDWTTGAVRAAVGYRLYDIAVVPAAIDFVTLRSLRPVKQDRGLDAAAADADAGPRARGGT